tara:strand:+ start:599 stop:967 length:369 start_codon:yes stop_codon:yes gene_type:complete
MDNRPLSPHITIQKKFLTAVFSIFHRLTGLGLSIGSIFITFWIALIAFGQDYYYLFNIFSTTLIFKFILLLWTVAIFYHLFNGIRYLFWSLSLGMDLNTVYISGYVVILLTILSSGIVWIFI